MAQKNIIIRFNTVSFEYGKRPILHEANFSVREGSKITLMGQNGAGKSTIFRLIAGDLKPESGTVVTANKLTLATARQVIPGAEMELTVKEFFEKAFKEKIYGIEKRIKKVFEVVQLAVSSAAILKTLSGGQQARLLLAQALIRDSDILLLDEPTNNLDTQGITHLRQFLIDYPKTCIVISHDADFLNSFTEGVLYLDIFTHKVEQYVGDYFAVVEEIKARLERERMKNVRLEKDIRHRKDQANFFGQKGGHLRDVARKMNEKIEELEGDIVEVRREDKAIRNFVIPCQEDLSGRILELKSVSIMDMKNRPSKTLGNFGPSMTFGTFGKPVVKKVDVTLKKKERLLLAGPNGIGKTTLLETLSTGHAKGEYVTAGVRIGYYRQDFSMLDFEETVYAALSNAIPKIPGASGTHGTEQELRSCAAGFLLDTEILKTRIGSLSEGQKGLVAFAKLVLERPGLLILDEPTNHINFRHIPVIAHALDRYEGAMILVSHVPDFVKQIKIDYVLDLEKL